jgi:desulfoferrodoxin (superoxide reductase-like protein)
MKRIRFHICPTCGNILTSTGEAELSCCGRKLTALIPKPADDEHCLTVEIVEDDYYITFSHEMKKAHYLSFIAFVSSDRILLVKLYPEQSGEVRFTKMYDGKIYFGCNQHGLWVNG